MLISASRRTDIPAFYSDWFFNRLKEGYVLVRSPVNPRQVSRVPLSPDVVDGIVFWTKNPLPMLSRLDLLRDYAFYFQFTLTSYGTDAEPGVPSKNDVLIPAFRRLSDTLGPERVVWRYDPIFLSEKYTLGRHAEFFDKIAERLGGTTKKCVISFMDTYRHIEKRIRLLNIASLTEAEEKALARRLSRSASRRGLVLETCAESVDLSMYGIHPGRCVDAGLIEKISGRALHILKDKGQRPACLCSASVDIGAYGTCPHGCVYCYAARGAATGQNAGKHDPLSPMLFGNVREGDRITARHVKSDRIDQLIIRD